MNFKQTKRTVVTYGGGLWLSIPAEYIKKFGIEKGTIMVANERDETLTFEKQKV